MKIICYKGMDNRVFMFGLNPVDFFVALLLIVPVFVICMLAIDILGFVAAIVIAIAAIAPLLAIGWSDKVKNRPRGIHLYIATFMQIPGQLGIPQSAEVRKYP